MKAVAAGLADDIYLRAGHASVIGAISVKHHRRFRDFVRTERIVACARVVDIEVRIHVVGAIQRVQNRRAGDAVDACVSLAAASTGDHAWNSEHDVRDIAAIHRQFRHLRSVKTGCEVGVLGLQDRGLGANFDHFRGPLHRD